MDTLTIVFKACEVTGMLAQPIQLVVALVSAYRAMRGKQT